MGYFDSFSNLDTLLNENDELDIDIENEVREAYTDEELAEELASLDEYTADDLEEEELDDIEEQYINLIVSNEQNFYNIMNVVAANEMNYYIENGTEMVYEEGKIKDFMKNVHKMIDTAWEKISKIFKTIKEKVDEFLDFSKKYAQKNKDVITGVSSYTLKDVVNVNQEKLDDDLYTNLAIEMGQLKNRILKAEKIEASDIDEMRGAIVKKNTKLSSKEFGKALEEYFGTKTTGQVSYSGQQIYKELVNGNESLRQIARDSSSTKKMFAAFKKEAKEVEKKCTEKGCMSMLSLVRAGNNICGAIQRAKAKALSTHLHNLNRAAREIVKKNKKGSAEDKTSTGESASMFGDYSYIQ